MSTLLVHATAREGGDVATRRSRSLELGVGKVAATLSLTRALSVDRPDAVLLFGVCGAYPPRHLLAGVEPLALLDHCVVVEEQLIDEGVLTPAGFRDLGSMKLAKVGPYFADAELSAAIEAVLKCPAVRGATVSTGAGVDSLSQAYAQRSGAAIENMEGAAVAAVCEAFALPFAQLRVVSNRTGDRERGGWDLDGAVAKLGASLDAVLAARILP